MSIEKMEIGDLAGYLENRGGVSYTFPQAGSPVPGESAPTLMEARCREDGATMPKAQNQNDIGSLVLKTAPTAPAWKPGG